MLLVRGFFGSETIVGRLRTVTDAGYFDVNPVPHHVAGVLQFSLHTPTNVSALMKDNVASEISNEVNALLSVW
ncbi:hypothetical protein NIIDMKKI_68760 [Mycobacterium kansasii]|uniref:Uncharacterized protein n=1 Tax=Mycobacterium kansasii TaxID=1768 RepID=A0A7G1ILC2_MYCKA|nr:hypothetical protein NIIDMKKI_68760 [Mycobacterium kansasii]